MTHNFRGKRWILEASRGTTDGECDAPHVKGKKLKAPLESKTRHALDTIIHEALHACVWSLADEDVSETARDISKLLWRLGWRKE